MSSTFPWQQNSSQTYNCDWTINVTYCFGQDYFQMVYGVTLYIALFIFLSSIWLLSWRLYSKPDMRLFRIKGFLTLEGFLFTQIFWGGIRVFNCIILMYNLFPGQWIVREVVLDISWFLGLVSVVTYLAGVIRTIPRMYFFRQNPHYKHALHLPNLRGIVGVYVSYVLVLGIIRITCAVFIGYFLQYPTENSHKLYKIMTTIYFCTCSISALLVAGGFWIYGNKLVRIANEGLHLLENVSGYPSRNSRIRRSEYVMSELEIKHKKLQRSVRKMRIINAAFIISFLIMGINLGIYAFLNEKFLNNIDISKVLAAITNWMPLILNVLVMGGITYGEMKLPDKSEPKFENIVFPTTSNIIQPSNMEQIFSDTDAESLVHSRNNSTDSDAPLLRWPPPVVTTNSTRRGSAQLDSPISVGSSSSPIIGTFGFASSSTSQTPSIPYPSIPSRTFSSNDDYDDDNMVVLV